SELQLLRQRIAELVAVLERQVDPHRFDTWERIADRGAILPLPVLLIVPVVVELLALAPSSHTYIFSLRSLRRLRPTVRARSHGAATRSNIAARAGRPCSSWPEPSRQPSRDKVWSPSSPPPRAQVLNVADLSYASQRRIPARRRSHRLA